MGDEKQTILGTIWNLAKIAFMGLVFWFGWKGQEASMEKKEDGES